MDEVSKTTKILVIATMFAFAALAYVLALWAVTSQTVPTRTDGACHSITEDSPPNDCKFTRISPDRGVWHK
jgi:hypothetical protein